MRCRPPVHRAVAPAAALAALVCIPANATKLSFAEVDRTIMPSVAQVVVTIVDGGGVSYKTTLSQGSGFVVDRDKQLVLTTCDTANFGILARKRTIEIQFAKPTGSAKRTAEFVECNSELNLAIVRVRTRGPSFPPAVPLDSAINPQLNDGLFVLGFVSLAPAVVPARFESRYEGTLDGVLLKAGSFYRSRSNLEPSGPSGINIEDMLHDMSDLMGGPLISSQGKLVGVNTFSSGQHVRVALTQVERGVIPKGVYYARTLESIASFINWAPLINR